MIEAMLGVGSKREAADNSDIPFPAGTPFKGIARSANFIYGDALATLVGLSAGAPMNVDGGWLHFIEDSGLELYIAKKPIRCAATYEQIMAATNNGAKEVSILGETYICRLMTGAISTTANAVPANAGGEWNRYMYNVYDTTDRAGIPSALLWGNYTRTMLGLAAPSGTDLSDGVFTICAETLANGYCLRGNDWQNSSGGYPIKGIWNMPPNNPQVYYGWRPILVKKSSIPPTPFRGEVLAANFIDGPSLLTAIGVVGASKTALTPQSPWLKFVDNGKTFYIAKKCLYGGILREELHTAGAVYGTKEIVFGGNRYKVRLMKGVTTDPGATAGGEYTDYFSRCTTFWQGNVADRWANYTGADVGWSNSTSNGDLTLCQEANSASGGWVTRGYPGFLGVWYQIANTTHVGYGWRPVLELVGPA